MFNELARCVQGVREVEEWMSRSSGIPLEELRPHMFLFRDKDATSHLLRCAPICAAAGGAQCTIQAARRVRGKGRLRPHACVLRALALVATCIAVTRRPVCS